MAKTIVIAEAGVNHNGDMELAKKLIDAASEAGVDYVKFQTFKTENLVSVDAKKAAYQKENLGDSKSDSQFEMLKKLELDKESHYLLIEHCNARNIKFLSTPFDFESIEFLDSLELDLFKVSSGDLTNLPFLRAIGKHNKQTVISTGMADLTEIKDAVSVLTEAGTELSKITVLHCNTAYPTPMEDVNLNVISTLKKEIQGVKIGYSDHTLGIEVPIAAVSLGAELIEKHFTLDKTMEGPDHKASLSPEELKSMMRAIRNIDKALGSFEKKPTDSELKNIAAARKSLHLLKDLHSGHEITENDLIPIRPGDGISPMQFDKIVGRKINRDLSAGHKLSINDLS